DALHRASGGLFDITSGVPRPPSGWQQVQRDGRSVRLPVVGMAIDFGAFGPAYAADCAGALLTRQGARHGYVSLGEHTLVIGPQPDDTPWLFDIPDPRQQGERVATLPVLQGGLATSGEHAPRAAPKARHLLYPRGGRATRWRSISVVAPVAVAAGTCSTIAMLKQEAGLAFLRASRMNYLAVDGDGDIYTNTLVEA
ncbi:MAG: FAD:protein FMN transferase, partial [Burkholderiales bacterium]|nr:FAD:protein FMN transferase [Burkholderiales bacterium]